MLKKNAQYGIARRDMKIETHELLNKEIQFKDLFLNDTIITDSYGFVKLNINV